MVSQLGLCLLVGSLAYSAGLFISGFHYNSLYMIQYKHHSCKSLSPSNLSPISSVIKTHLLLLRKFIATSRQLSSSHSGLNSDATTSLVSPKDNFLTVLTPIEWSYTIKKSKFVAKLSPAISIDDALLFVEKVSDKKASHNCWAFRSSNSPSYVRFSDDGEPAGTAGRPILQALETERIVDTVLVITRYYGGIKLGTGGLVRAYGTTAREALQAASLKIIIPMTMVKIIVDMVMIGLVYQLINHASNWIKVSEEYSNDSIELILKIPSYDVDVMKLKLSDISKGGAYLEILP